MRVAHYFWWLYCIEARGATYIGRFCDRPSFPWYDADFPIGGINFKDDFHFRGCVRRSLLWRRMLPAHYAYSVILNPSIFEVQTMECLIFTSGRSHRSSMDDKSPRLICLMEAFRGQISIATWVIDVTEFNSKAICDLWGCLEAITATEAM